MSTTFDDPDIDPERPLYPDITVRLTGADGNAMSVISKVRVAMRRAGVSPIELDQFSAEALSGDYDHVLRTAMRWVDVE